MSIQPNSSTKIHAGAPKFARENDNVAHREANESENNGPRPRVLHESRGQREQGEAVRSLPAPIGATIS